MRVDDVCIHPTAETADHSVSQRLQQHKLAAASAGVAAACMLALPHFDERVPVCSCYMAYGTRHDKLQQ